MILTCRYKSWQQVNTREQIGSKGTHFVPKVQCSMSLKWRISTLVNQNEG